MNCLVCDRTSSRLFKKYAYWIRSCKSCGHQFAEIELSNEHAEVVYNNQYFQGGGAGYSDYLSEAQLLRARGRRYSRLLTRYITTGTMLDVGAAAGFILQGFVDCGWKGRGIDPNPTMAEYACKYLGLDVNPGTLEEFNGSDRYDLISMIQVVAHFFDLHKAFSAAAEATQPNGFWLIETWNRESCTARAFGKHWHEYSPPSVLHWFSPKSLQMLAAQFGFREVARGRPSKWLNGAHAKSLLRYKLESSQLGRVASKMIGVIPDHLPIPYPAEDLFYILFQKSL